MKKIINGKVYDTRTAKCVGEWDNGCYPNDFNYCSEDLYQKKTGEFFLHGDGGAMSKYNKSCGNNSTIGCEKIVPLSFAAAKEWAEDNLTGEQYEDIFGIVEDEEKKSVSFYIKYENAEKIKLIASEKGIPVSALIEELIEAL